MLGEVATDAEGRFRIIYTLEQFQSGEGQSTVRVSTGKRADLSFRVFDQNGTEIAIKGIEALHREYRPDQIIFNVPTPVDVTIFLDAPRESTSTSEYEQLNRQLAPVIQDVPLAELSDEDAAFLGNELALEQQRDVQQRIEWLRRCALLAQETNLPIEAFYGWGRKDVPAQFSELAALPVKDLPSVLEKLSNLSDQNLTAVLLAAIEAKIVPPRLRERASVIISPIRRRAQKEYVLRLRLERAPSGETLAGFTVTTFDAEANNRDLGTDVTDALGEFAVAYFAANEAHAVERGLRFRVRGPGIGDPIEVRKRIRPDVDAPVGIRISFPDAQPTLRRLGGNSRIGLPDAILETLEKKHGIQSLADIRRIGGLGRIQELRAHDSAAALRLDALADLDRLSGDLNETSALLDRRYDSVVAIASASRKEFVAAMSTGKGTLIERRATELHIAAKAQVDILDQIFAGIAIDAANGIRPPSAFATGDYFPAFPQEQEHE